jgi:peroxiredoxin
MTIGVGDKIPSATLMQMGEAGPEPVSTDELFADKKVVLFSVPGAFTPTCSAQHLPGFISQADEIKAKGADLIVCIAVNDVFVMAAWGKGQDAGDKVLMLADGNGELSTALGLSMDASGFGMGTRGQRFSLIAEGGIVTTLNVEAPGAFEVSSAEHMLTQL